MIKVRASSIKIEMPREGDEPWIQIIVQRLEKNGNIVNTVDRWDSFNVRFSTVVNEAYPIIMDTSSKMFTVNDVANHLGFVVKNWLARRYNGTIQANGDVILN